MRVFFVPKLRIRKTKIMKKSCQNMNKKMRNIENQNYEQEGAK